MNAGTDCKNPIEDAGSGTSLIQELYDHDIPAIGIHPYGDKVMRMSAQTAKIEAGTVPLPQHAPWLDDLKSELLAFATLFEDFSSRGNSCTQVETDAGFQRVNRRSRLTSTWLDTRPSAVMARMPKYICGIRKLYCA